MAAIQMSPDPLTSSDLAASFQSFDTDGFTNDPPSESSVEHHMSEQQLRELYDNEEIERFLHLFSAYVTEVRLPDTPSSPRQLSQSQASTDPEVTQSPDGPSLRPLHPGFNFNPNQSWSEIIAVRYLLPALPPARLEPPIFTLGRLRLTAQRLYLSIQPAYGPFFIHLAKLATWKDKKTSLIYCTIFWVMWYHNLLLPCLCLRVFYSLIRRKIFPYPTLEELREHRSEVSRANEFGDQISARLSASSFGVKEIWRIFKVFNKTTKAKAKSSAKEKAREKGFSPPLDENDASILSESEGATVLDDTEDSQDAKDFKRVGLYILSELADLHERIKNIFIWRRPASSRIYGTAIFFIFVVTLLLPAKYIAKLTYFLGGAFFWHVTPIIAALSSADRARLPPAFADVPTDADYAMELITDRVAAGLDVRPTKARKHNKHARVNTTEGGVRSGRKDGPDEPHRRPEDKERSVDWKKWGERAAIGKTWAEDSKRLIGGRQNSAAWPPQNPLVPQVAVAIGRPEIPAESHTYPAQHTSAPGLVTITPTVLLFTPLTSTNPKFVILLNDIRGVKKAGLLKGLHIQYLETPDGEKTEKEEKFLWVGARDELFARLVGSEGRRWLKV